MSELPGQSGHALPDQLRQFRAKNGHSAWPRGHAGAQRCGGPASVAAKPRNFDMFCASRYQLATLSRNIFTSARRLAATFATASEA